MLVLSKKILNILICSILFACNKSNANNSSKGRSYYLSISGDDKNDGSAANPIKTIAYLNTINLNPGDTVFFKGAEIFKGNLILDSTKSGVHEKLVVITSYGNGNAIIDAGNGTAVTIYNSSYVNMHNLICKGAGRKDGNTKAGIVITNCNNISIDNIDVSGFQKSGLQIYSCKNVIVNKVYAHDNDAAGIGVEGNFNNKLTTNNIQITYCTAENNPGDPTNLTNHSGNGIIVGHCTNLLIEYCTATNNGWDMPRIGNGPVGIWCYEADSVIIQRCISYQNKTSKGGEDGGGYDLDGGVTNSIIQYCLSYENQGSAFGIFQYAGASAWHNNTIRFCISENDGNVSAAHANAYIWNSSHDSSQFKNLLFYNNTIYNNKGAAISYSVESDHSNFSFYNNIFVAANNLIAGKENTDTFIANDWWSLQQGFNIDGNKNFHDWAIKHNKEQMNREIKGLNVIPVFKNISPVTLTDASQLTGLDKYKIISPSTLLSAGIGLHKLFNIDTGDKDFNGLHEEKNYLGACSNK